MKRYIWKRLLHLILILIGITFMSFALMHTVSTDTVDILYDQNGGANEAAAAARRASLGLDQDFLPSMHPGSLTYSMAIWEIPSFPACPSLR